ncbi:MAG: type I secretion protein, partial [Tabrizicola sp.]|nr:type I secretion protein [Tabrizicola sp.]
MPTTFNWIYLGNSTTFVDPTEGNSTMESQTAFQNQTFGSAGDPLYTRIVTATTINNGGAAGVLDTDNTVSNDQISTVLNGLPTTLTYDGVVVYTSTVTYVDGTTGTVSAILVQTTSGDLFLAPPPSNDANVTVFEAKPIQSITFGEPTLWENVNLTADRWFAGFDDGWVDGTGAGNLIDSAYVESIANGSDRIDNNDGINAASVNDDRIRAGGGADTVYAGLGNDLVYGGAGGDFLYGNDGIDTIYGEDTSDRLYGGNDGDLLYGGGSGDSLFGDAGNDSLFGEAGADRLEGDVGSDTLYGNDGIDT